MRPDDARMAREIEDAMAQIRGARVHPETAEAVDETLRELRERTAETGSDEVVTSALYDAEQAFKAGDTAQAVQRLSRALLQLERSPTTKRIQDHD